MISEEPVHPNPTSAQTFDDILATADLPPPGPGLYTARRNLWLAQRQNVQHAPVIPSNSRQRLEQLLSTPNAVGDEHVWNNGLKKVWKNLEAGGRLKRRLPMALIIKVIHAAWLRDETWPAGAIAPEPDDILPGDIDLASSLYPPSSSMTEYSSVVTAPWMITNYNRVE